MWLHQMSFFHQLSAILEMHLANAAGQNFEALFNFRTSLEDVEALPELIVRIGRGIDAESRAKT